MMRVARIAEAVATPISGVSAALFAGLSAARGKRFFHPDGVAFEGTVTFHDATRLPFEGSYSARARLSKGAGLPGPLPDVLGLAIKIPDLDQDLLLATSGESSVTRHLLVPSAGFFARPYSSVLPYEFDGASIVFGARAAAELVDASDQQMDDLATYAASGRLRFDLTWGPAGTSEVEPFASLVLERSYDGTLAFNPFNSRPELKPAGGLNRLRLASYRSSQQARPDTTRTA